LPLQVVKTALSLQVGNSTILQQNAQATNGVLHLIDSFPLHNAAFNTSMIALLEMAGDFGPFNDSQVCLSWLHAQWASILTTCLVLLPSLLNLVCDAVQRLYFSLLLECIQIAVAAIALATFHTQPASMHAWLQA